MHKFEHPRRHQLLARLVDPSEPVSLDWMELCLFAGIKPVGFIEAVLVEEVGKREPCLRSSHKKALPKSQLLTGYRMNFYKFAHVRTH